MLGPLPLIAMRQQQGQALRASPTWFRPTKINSSSTTWARLRSRQTAPPNHQVIGFGGRITVLKREHGFFGQYRIVTRRWSCRPSRIKMLAGKSDCRRPIFRGSGRAARRDGERHAMDLPGTRTEALHKQAGIGLFSPMPQSTLKPPSPIRRRSSMISCTRDCSVKFSGMVVNSLISAQIPSVEPRVLHSSVYFWS